MSNPGYSSSGSILIYVLWILVVISVLAFHVASTSRVTTLSQAAFASQLKMQLQLESAIQFSRFKIVSNQWQNKSYQLNLNDQKIDITVFNESGFVSIYNMGDKVLKRIFESLGFEEETVDALQEAVQQVDKPERFNSFLELRQFPGIDDEAVSRLVPLVSIFHEEALNLMNAPTEVLMLIPGIDQFRVQKLMEAEDEADRVQLRKELAELIMGRQLEFSEDIGSYYRVHISVDGVFNRVFLKYNRQQKKYKVVLIVKSEEVKEKIENEL